MRRPSLIADNQVNGRQKRKMSLVTQRRDGDTIILTLDRPPANAVDLAVTEEFNAAFAALETDPPTGGVVLTGKGTVFCSGVDFKAVPGYSAADKRLTISNINRFVRRLYGLPVATVAAVNGHAIGAGVVLALACDVRLFAQGEAKLGLTEVSAGIPYPACPMEVVTAELEPSLRRRLVLTGDVFGPADAESYGIADAVVALPTLIDDAVERARTLSAHAGYATVKYQLKADTLRRMDTIIEEQSDPMLESWV